MKDELQLELSRAFEIESSASVLQHVVVSRDRRVVARDRVWIYVDDDFSLDASGF